MPREGHDISVNRSLNQRDNFNPRAPRGARRNHCHTQHAYQRFQSTCPARGTTIYRKGVSNLKANFNPRAPRGARLLRPLKAFLATRFQSTCPARGTTPTCPSRPFTRIFQSTCPARGTTPTIPAATLPIAISIHVPREGHDYSFILNAFVEPIFQSTCPARGTTKSLSYSARLSAISIHVPREGHDHLP